MASSELPNLQTNLKAALDQYRPESPTFGPLFDENDVAEIKSFFFTDSRLNSFALRSGGWTYDKPEKTATCSSNLLALNGFFFPAINRKTVTCVFCQLDVTCSAHLDPLLEHARLNPRCYFVTLAKPEEEWTIEDGMYLLQFRRRALSVKATEMRKRDSEERREERRRNRRQIPAGGDAVPCGLEAGGVF
ncbi:hypothetical protein L596_012907 [Steinernema carpocapsae]|uniref:Uncharacterized protein n=1 Tax=Steinernema carpocapsae TaxID=34508 RepID=A0A4U5NZG7_STECR|nr:hypothetical protein L596_012907 [Steinernema carpocapsae]